MLAATMLPLLLILGLFALVLAGSVPFSLFTGILAIGLLIALAVELVRWTLGLLHVAGAGSAKS